MIKIKTSELTGAALDWAVAKAAQFLRGTDGMWSVVIPNISTTVHLPFPRNYSPSTRWSQGGAIIERERIEIIIWRDGWSADYRDKCGCQSDGPTPLIAAMRCFCASKLGEEVEIPIDFVL